MACAIKTTIDITTSSAIIQFLQHLRFPWAKRKRDVSEAREKRPKLKGGTANAENEEDEGPVFMGSTAASTAATWQ